MFTMRWNDDGTTKPNSLCLYGTTKDLLHMQRPCGAITQSHVAQWSKNFQIHCICVARRETLPRVLLSAANRSMVPDF